MKNILKLYMDGFKNMPRWGRTVWIIIGIKLMIFFVIMKILFFPNILKKLPTDIQKADYVLEHICDDNN